MAKIFVSYSRADSHFIDPFIKLLRKVYGKNEVWYDDEIHGGADWWALILAEIAQSDLFIYLISPEALVSPYCYAEWQEAVRLHKAFLPVMIRRTDLKLAPPDLRAAIQKTQYIDFSGRAGLKDPDKTADLFAAVKIMLESCPQTPLPPAQTHPIIEPSVNDKSKPKNLLTEPWAIVLAAIIGGMFLLASVYLASQLGRDDSSNGVTPTSVTEIALVAPTDTQTPSDSPTPTVSLTPSQTPTETITLDIVEVVKTLDAQATAQVRATNIAGTSTQSVGETLTIEAYTDTPTPTYTPTPNLTASINAFTTQRALDETATQARGVTLTVAAYTDTPTPTETFTRTPTLTPREQAEQRARIPVTANADWTPYMEEIDGVEMALVPVGCFMMGSEDGDSDEEPVHQQCFDEPFWIDVTEVTQAQFEIFGGEKANPNGFEGDNRPVERITWFEARDYCELRGGRLPTEREWEYAARGHDSLIYPWGDEFVAKNVVYSENSNNQTAEVGSRPDGVSWVGAMDMSGNVWEWTNSLSLEYPYESSLAEDTNNSTDVRALRGSSWGNDSYYTRASYRVRNTPTYEFYNRGLRCVRPLN